MVGKALGNGIVKAEQILRMIDALKPKDRVVVTWHDACRVTNDPDVRPEYYSTPKETQGTVCDCVPDPEYPDVFYLIIYGETTGGRADYYDAIPVAWIAKIERLESIPIKTSRKEPKFAAEPYIVKRIMNFEGGRQVSDSGGVDKLAKKWVASPLTCKFTEDILKVVA